MDKTVVEKADRQVIELSKRRLTSLIAFEDAGTVSQYALRRKCLRSTLPLVGVAHKFQLKPTQRTPGFG